MSDLDSKRFQFVRQNVTTARAHQSNAQRQKINVKRIFRAVLIVGLFSAICAGVLSLVTWIRGVSRLLTP